MNYSTSSITTVLLRILGDQLTAYLETIRFAYLLMF